MTASTGPTGFDVCGALPAGTTVLEASAGTGKTYTIAALAARYVAEGLAELGELMLVTFGRTATNELRLRVRERLVTVERRLAEAIAGQPAPPHLDGIERLLTTGTDQQLTERHSRIARALSDFDAATIATTHEFCLRMLDELGILGDREPDVVFVENLSELAREVVTDVFLRRYAGSEILPPLDFDEAQRIARQVVESGDARLVPTVGADRPEVSDEGDSRTQDRSAVAAERVAFFVEVRTEVMRRKELGRLFTYDDMLTRLRDALADSAHGAAAVRRLRERYRIVMVDEFQDTDPVQWDILRRAFHQHATLVLIGDPKQAIYAFRGADVYSYLDAVGEADTVSTLSTNWRSDQSLVKALGVLMGDAALGDERIVVRPVEAHHHGARLLAPPGDPADRFAAPVRLRIFPHDSEAERVPSVSVLRPQIVEDLVADVTGLLASGTTVDLPPPGGADLAAGPRPVGPSDIAVLVRRNERADVLREALVAAGVPAVVLGATSVYATSTAGEWLTLLRALEQPRQALVRRAALTCFLGWSFSRLATADDNALTDLTQQVRWWSRVVRSRGVAALLETITRDTRLAERVLGQVNGERLLTDLRHIGQALHAASVSRQLGVGALVEWLQERVDEAKASTPMEGMRRLETDAESVQILTVHHSKGLEFPIVYLPEAWDRYVNAKDTGGTLRLHDGPEIVLDVGGLDGSGRGDRLAQYRREECAEDLRLLYVALTRAQCQVVTWWAPSINTPGSALQRFLYGPRREGVEPDPSYPIAGDPFSCSHLGDGFSLERVAERGSESWQPEQGSPPVMTARAFDRLLDLDWRRTSYSALTAAVHGVDLTVGAVGSEAEPVKEDDEASLTDVPPPRPVAPADPELARLSPMGELPSGVQFGTVVHAVLESVDLQADDLLVELRTVIADQLARAQPGVLTVDGLADGLLPALQTPLGPLADNLRLCDIAPRDRLAELDFELPLAGGEVSTSDVRLGQLGPLLRSYLAPTDPLASYPERLEHPALAEESLRGYLTGSIDAVLRIRRATDDSAPRYLVVDYKTNWLGDFDGEPLTLGDYAPPLLADAMMQAHYPLQALLYSVAVHRYLRWRQPGYDPDVHLGGVLYLFVRGMAGPDTPTVAGVPCGVFSWRPPAALITDLSDLMEGALPPGDRDPAPRPAAVS
ncbi:MAG: UvrD-helicase domain-containing protein [Propionibacteriaceae bacterium]